VRPALIDTDIISMFLRGHRNVTGRFEAYLSEYGMIHFSILTYYEIVSGLKGAKRTRSCHSGADGEASSIRRKDLALRRVVSSGFAECTEHGKLMIWLNQIAPFVYANSPTKGTNRIFGTPHPLSVWV